ncbi:hypothetical protein LCM23_23420 [Cytobacillus kochii]|uniref:hypothetical protein n=1 Tax=Cytobacillus kochii TaxID=859143 RepID=UPI001CD372C5|nr:hypothetical protein [Cytobacillus kochii]MCA1028989.1 hypothetical protein [Cytobacillus kochii]
MSIYQKRLKQLQLYLNEQKLDFAIVTQPKNISIIRGLIVNRMKDSWRLLLIYKRVRSTYLCQH